MYVLYWDKIIVYVLFMTGLDYNVGMTQNLKITVCNIHFGERLQRVIFMLRNDYSVGYSCLG